MELIAIDVFRQLSEFSNKNKKYMWFVDWSRKLVELTKEKKVVISRIVRIGFH